MPKRTKGERFLARFAQACSVLLIAKASTYLHEEGITFENAIFLLAAMLMFVNAGFSEEGD